MTVSSTSSSSSSSSSTSSASSLTTLASNFSDFLSLLTTQLQNQDPTAPMDTNQFTSQLVQFTSVEEQINSNATLNSILTATQGQQLAQASSLVGQTAEFTSTSVPLQNSTGQIDYTVSGAQQVQITVTNSAGATVRSDTVNATAGANVWKWDGTSTSGAAEPDGTYTATVTTVPTVSGSTGTAVPFTVVGTITGAQQSNGTVQLMFGSEATTFDKVVKFSGSSSSTSSSTSSGS